MNNTRIIIGLLCAGALAFACGPRSSSETPVALALALPVHPTAPLERAHRNSAPRAEVKLNTHFTVDVKNNAVRFAFLVKNVGGKHAEVNFANGQAYDFVVVDSTGRRLWQWSEGRMFTQIVQNRQLGAGETMQVGETWKKQSVRAGRYTVIATLKSTNYPAEERAEFVLP
jgi:hypothetical protein